MQERKKECSCLWTVMRGIVLNESPTKSRYSDSSPYVDEEKKKQ